MSRIDTDGKPRPDDIHLTQRDLERRWQLSGRTLERWRSEPYGPRWVVIGGSIRYRLTDVLAWEAAHTKGK